MPFCSRHYTLREYECFTRERIVPGYISLPKSVFDNLENFILLNSKKFTYDSDPVELLSISVRKNIGKVISARNINV